MPSLKHVPLQLKEEPEELSMARYVVTVLSALPNVFGFSVKVASSALAGPNDAMAKSAMSAILAILIVSSLTGHQFSERYDSIRGDALSDVRNSALFSRFQQARTVRLTADAAARIAPDHLTG
jgi:hypothetical protein